MDAYVSAWILQTFLPHITHLVFFGIIFPPHTTHIYFGFGKTIPGPRTSAPIRIPVPHSWQFRFLDLFRVPAPNTPQKP